VRRTTTLIVALAATACLLSVQAGQARGGRTLYVSTAAQFAHAAAELQYSGGTIVLAPTWFREKLEVGPRGWNELRIVGTRNRTHVQQLVLRGTQRVSISDLAISPIDQDASIHALQSARIEIDHVFFSAAGTPYSSELQLPISNHVTVRDSEFTHCGDRSPHFVNCILLWRVSNLTVEDSDFHDCRGCDFINGKFGTYLALYRNHFARTLPCRMGADRCIHQDDVQLFGGRGLEVSDNVFGVYWKGAAQLYITNHMSHIRIVNNLFLGTDPRVPRLEARVAMVIGSADTKHVPRDVRIVNNTVLTGARRKDGYLGSIRMTNQYGAVPLRVRPILANNIIAFLKDPNQVCSEVQASISNLILNGEGCSKTDTASSEILTPNGRPTRYSAFLLGTADPALAPPTDITGRRRGQQPDIGAFQYRGPR
jgi:hypothetical protein